MLNSSSHMSAEAPLAAMSQGERRCLVTGEIKAKENLIRFVVGPEQNVVPDVAGKLPGRGLWVSADRAALQQAISKTLFSRAAKQKVLAEPALLDQTEQLLAKRCLELLGLARGAGAAVLGQPQIEHALVKAALSYILIASDAGSDCRKKLSSARLISIAFTREQLGSALGHSQLASVGLKPHPLADKLENEIARWHGVKAQVKTSTDDDRIANNND